MAQSQGVAINESGDPPHTSAMLDVSSITKGLLIPVMDYSQREAIGSPATGLLIFQTDKGPGFYYFTGTVWEPVGDEVLTIDDLIDGYSDGYSLFLGNRAGDNDNGTNNYNVAVGISALRYNIAGASNVALGYQSLYNNVVSNNMALGYRAMYTNTNGSFNSGIGSQSLFFNTTGKQNTAVGYSSLYRNTTGEYNVGVGYYANSYNQAGSNNTMIGYKAGQGGTTAHSKSGNIHIGYMAGYNDTTDNKLYIENSSSDSPLIYGDFDTDLLRVNGTLYIDTAYHFPAADGTSGQVLATDGTGAVGWTTVSTGGGPTALNDLTDAKTTGNSVFLGADAGSADDGSDNRNIGVGKGALSGNTTGNYNTSLGYWTSTYNIDGNYNAVLGAFADYRNQHGSNNTLIGYQAGSSGSYHSKSGNVRIGYYAGYNDTTDNKLYIENSSSSSPLIWGDFENDSLRINGTLDINEAYSFPTTDGSSNQVLKTNGNGALYWSGDQAGAGGIDGLSDASADHTWGILGLGSTFPSYAMGAGNVAIGINTMDSTTSGAWNTAIGTFANNYNENGNANTCIGYGAGRGVSKHSKSGCIMIGYFAGRDELNSNRLYIEPSNSTTPLIYGEFDNDLVRINGDLEITDSLIANVGIDWLNDAQSGPAGLVMGKGAGSPNAPYLDNVAVGDSTLSQIDLGSKNVAVGFKSLKAMEDGQGNTAVGWLSMLYYHSGGNNTAVGREAMGNNGIGSNNTAIGYNSGPGPLASESTIGIGYNAQPAANYHAYIGNTSMSWIGGQVTWSTFASDSRASRNIREDVKGLDFIMKLRPVTYSSDKDNLDAILGVNDESTDAGKYDIEKIKQSGFLAQEVEQAARESNYDFSGVHAPANEHTPYSLSYSQFVVPLVKAVQEQQEMIMELKAQNQKLVERVEELERE